MAALLRRLPNTLLLLPKIRHNTDQILQFSGAASATSSDGSKGSMEFLPWHNGGGTLHKSASVDCTAVIETGAVVHCDAVLGKEVCIGSGAVVGPSVSIGHSTKIGYNVVLSNCSVGQFCTIHNGASIGQDGENRHSVSRTYMLWTMLKDCKKEYGYKLCLSNSQILAHLLVGKEHC